MQSLVIVNASGALKDAEVQAKVGPLQTQINDHVLPAWQSQGMTPVQVEFATVTDIPDIPPDAWPIFLNKHSNDPGALGWHDDTGGKIFSRVFVGDCLRFGLDWGVTLSHEAIELLGDPDIRKVYRMKNGRLAAYELCDACEADDLAYVVDGHKMSNFVLPAYFSTAIGGQFDYRGDLHAPCPALTPGGYMSITDENGDWTQVQADRLDGLAGRRAIMQGYRRQQRSQRSVRDLIELP